VAVHEADTIHDISSRSISDCAASHKYKFMILFVQLYNKARSLL